MFSDGNEILKMPHRELGTVGKKQISGKLRAPFCSTWSPSGTPVLSPVAAPVKRVSVSGE